jgi:putative DNA primase/helicase
MDARTVVDQMLQAGLECPPMPLDLTGKIRRWDRKRNSWYRLREMRLDSGRFVVVGSFGNWKTGLSARVDVDWQGISDEERAAFKARQAEQVEAQARARQQAAALAAMSAADLWRQGVVDGRSAYLDRKGVQGEACRHLADGSLLVPLLRYDLPREQALRAVQRIWPDGRKRFTRGFEKPGACLRLGVVVAGLPILLAEGYATALTLRMATERRVPVVMCLDAGNLRPVAELLRGLWPDNRLLICADDDWRTAGPDGAPLNVGRVKAGEVARRVPGVDVVYPVWRGAREPGDTDFNDLHAREGLDAVRRQVGWVVQALKNKAVPHA